MQYITDTCCYYWVNKL